MSRQHITRRTFLTHSALLATGAFVTACTSATPMPAEPTTAPVVATQAPVPTTKPTEPPKPTDAPKPTVAPTKAAKLGESPMLADLAKQGKLPSVEQRLPREPLVVKPEGKVGSYGGTLRFGDLRVSNPNQLRALCQSGLFTYNQTGSEILVDAAKAFKFSTDGKVLTIELREGQRWSDGEPFTVDDIIFWWEDYTNNRDLTASLSAFWRPGGKPAVFRKISPTTLEIEFAVPYPVVMDQLGRSYFSTDPSFMMPKHYLQKWHIKYNPGADDQAKKDGFPDWKQAFTAKASPASGHMDVGKPTLWAWVPVKMASDRVQMERNPYFHHVDTEGNQLPYIDRVDCVLTGENQVHVLKTASGEFDYEILYLSLKDMPVLQASAEQGKYRVLLPQSLRTAMLMLMPNQTNKDAVLAELFRKRDFRIALSLGINRPAMNEALFFGLGKPFPATCHPSMSFFKPEWATAYVDFDPKKANALLDGLGLTKKDSEGFRTRPDGAGRLSLLIEIGNPVGPKVEMAEMIQKDWKQIGIEAVVKNQGESLYAQRRSQVTEIQIGTWHTDRAGLFGRSNPLFYGYDGLDNVWGAAWAQWFMTDGKQGVEPPQQIKDHKALFDQYRQTVPGSPEFNRLGEKYYAFFTEELPMIGTIGLEPWPLVVSKRLQNVPEKDIWWGADTNFVTPYKPTQWYIKE